METRIGEIAKMMASEDKEAMEKAMEKSRPSGRCWEFYLVNFVVFFSYFVYVYTCLLARTSLVAVNSANRLWQ